MRAGSKTGRFVSRSGSMKTVENAHSESFNGGLREEFLNTTQFPHVIEARRKAQEWFNHHNEQRPHNSLDCQTPNEFAARCLAYKAGQIIEMAAL